MNLIGLEPLECHLTAPKSSSERVAKGPAVTLTVRCARIMMKAMERWTLIDCRNHWLEYAARHTAALCAFTTHTYTNERFWK
jgi:hypothetical protein